VSAYFAVSFTVLICGIVLKANGIAFGSQVMWLAVGLAWANPLMHICGAAK
jgi:hypothetical protein